MSEARTAGVRLRAGVLSRWMTASIVLSILLSACSNANIRGIGADLPATPVPERQRLLSASEQREHLRILAAYGGVYREPRLQEMMEKTVDKLVAASERPEQKYEVTILNSPAVNAFALPNGELYVTRGLIALANDNSELASVLAHEMAHVIARHAAIREDQARQAALVNRVATDLLSDPQLGALALAKSKIALANFSRAQEFEADGIGVGIAARAGYDPYGAERFLNSMGQNAHLKVQRGSIDPRAPDFLSSHPATPERVSNAVVNARQFTGPGSGARDKSEYLGVLDGMVFGEDPSEGFVRGRRFLHPKLGFTFTAPDGFQLDNTAQAVFGVKDSGAQALRLDVAQVPADQPLPEYLKSGWIENIDEKSIEEMQAGGFPAATATAKGEQWTFRLYVVRFGSDVYRIIFAAKNRTEAVDKSFRDSIATFRRMTVQEIAGAQPLKLKVVQVKPGDTVEKFARRMAVSDRHAERFRVLNGLGEKDRPKPGSLVKMVVE
ncbi:MAG: M48 family metalloprotease [Alphaproteobacteria bacterium]|nr:M48 family metalloprotease [Alphaproteobacteria bacterium]